jgi:hypothetical protein
VWLPFSPSESPSFSHARSTPGVPREYVGVPRKYLGVPCPFRSHARSTSEYLESTSSTSAAGVDYTILLKYRDTILLKYRDTGNRPILEDVPMFQLSLGFRLSGDLVIRI